MKSSDFIVARHDLQQCKFIETRLPDIAALADEALLIKIDRFALHFGDQMKYSGRIGLTHRSSSPDEGELPGATPSWFFAPDQIRKRAKQWGPGGIDTRFGAAWSGFAPRLDRWLKVIEGHGEGPVKQVYLDTLNGRIPPDQGHILSLAE
jgi:hypothetical protein